MADPQNVKKFDEDADVTFVFPEDGGAKILAKKSKLSERNEVFQKQFNSDLQEDPIVVTDISYSVFCNLIFFIYKRSLYHTVSKKNFQEILYAANKYLERGLILKVVNFIITENFLCGSNLMDYFETLELYDIMQLNDHIKNIYILESLEVIQKMNFSSEAHMRLLGKILNSDILSCSEIQLYQAVIAMISSTKGNQTWAEAKEKLKDLKYLIRFPTMSASELIKCAKEPSLLSHEEVVNFSLWAQEKVENETLLSYSLTARVNIDNVVCKDFHFLGQYIRNSRNSNRPLPKLRCSFKECNIEKKWSEIFPNEFLKFFNNSKKYNQVH